MARLPGRRRRRARPGAGPVPDAAADRARPRAARGRARDAQHGLRQHHPDQERAVLPRQRGDRAQDPQRHPLERRGDGLARSAARYRCRRSHRDLRLLRLAVRRGLQPLLPGQGRGRRRRPGLLPGARLPRHLRARVPARPAERAAPGRLPAGEVQGAVHAVLLPAPAVDAGLLGVPDGLHGSRPDRRDLPGADEPLHARARDRGHLPVARVGLPRRRGDGRAGVAGPVVDRRAGGPGQPDLRGQLQPSAPGRPGARQREDHPGAGVGLPGRRLERDQAGLGPHLGPAARPGPGRRAGQPDEHHP